MITQHLSIDQMKESMHAPWIAGDFGALAREIGAPEAESFVARMKLEPDERVLDIACGTGNVTIPLARRGATVTGLDMMPHLLEEARARATREGLHIRFDEGFAETLPYPDGSFDVVVSMFGIMFSALPETVASEMARVLMPGGRRGFDGATWCTERRAEMTERASLFAGGHRVDGRPLVRRGDNGHDKVRFR
jgi:2-polyprenyl-3-methyl-5-hydroxy-6-metoxy-1,4-benzoquinol methylase